VKIHLGKDRRERNRESRNAALPAAVTAGEPAAPEIAVPPPTEAADDTPPRSRQP